MTKQIELERWTYVGRQLFFSGLLLLLMLAYRYNSILPNYRKPGETLLLGFLNKGWFSNREPKAQRLKHLQRWQSWIPRSPRVQHRNSSDQLCICTDCLSQPLWHIAVPDNNWSNRLMLCITRLYIVISGVRYFSGEQFICLYHHDRKPLPPIGHGKPLVVGVNF